MKKYKLIRTKKTSHVCWMSLNVRRKYNYTISRQILKKSYDKINVPKNACNFVAFKKNKSGVRGKCNRVRDMPPNVK